MLKEFKNMNFNNKILAACYNRHITKFTKHSKKLLYKPTSFQQTTFYYITRILVYSFETRHALKFKLNNGNKYTLPMSFHSPFLKCRRTYLLSIGSTHTTWLKTPSMYRVPQNSSLPQETRNNRKEMNTKAHVGRWPTFSFNTYSEMQTERN